MADDRFSFEKVNAPPQRFTFEKPRKSFKQDFMEGSERLGKAALGMGEVGAHLATGGIAMIPSLAVGARKLIGGAKPTEALSEMGRVGEALTYQPQTELGKHLVEKGLGPMFEIPAYPGKYLREKGYPQAGAAYDIGLQAATAAIPFLKGRRPAAGIPRPEEIRPEATGLGTPEIGPAPSRPLLTTPERKLLPGAVPQERKLIGDRGVLAEEAGTRTVQAPETVIRKPWTAGKKQTPEVYVRDAQGKLVKRPETKERFTFESATKPAKEEPKVSGKVKKLEPGEATPPSQVYYAVKTPEGDIYYDPKAHQHFEVSSEMGIGFAPESDIGYLVGGKFYTTPAEARAAIKTVKPLAARLKDGRIISNPDVKTYDALAEKFGVSKNEFEKVGYKGDKALEAPKTQKEIFFENPSQSQSVSSALEKPEQLRTPEDRSALKTNSTAIKILKDQTGALFLRGRGRVTPPPQTLPRTPQNVKLMYEITDSTLKDMDRLDWQKARNWLVRGFVDVSGNVKRNLVKNAGWVGQRAVEQKELIAGSPSRAQQIIEDAHKTIYDGLNRKESLVLDRIIDSRRKGEIDRYKVDQETGLPTEKHPMGMDGATHEQYLNNLQAIEGLDPAQVANLNKRSDAYFQVFKDQVDRMLDAGLIDAPQHQALSRHIYSPREFIQHIDPMEVQAGEGGGLINVPSSGIKPLSGGSINLLDYDSKKLMTESIARVENRIARNKANQSLYDMLLARPNNGIVEHVPQTGVPTGYAPVNVMIKGKPEQMMMPVEMAREWVKNDPLINQTMSEVLQWLTGSKILKALATGYNPAFAVTNMPRDIGLVWMANEQYSPHLPVAFGEALGDYAKTAADVFKRTGRYRDYINEGGGTELLTYYGRVGGQKEVNKLTKALGYIGETSELWTRLALRERAIRNGSAPQEATHIARNYLDFSLGGNITKGLDVGIPYLNASIQGTRSIVRAAKNNPGIFSYKAAQLISLGMGLYFANKMVNQRSYDQVDDRDKEANFIVTTPFKFTDDKGDERHLFGKVAKDQGQRIFTSIGEAIAARYFEGKIPSDQLLQAIGDFVQITPTQLIAPLQTSLFSYILNKNFWANKDLWTGPKGIEPKEEYRPGETPDFFVKLGQATGLSPARTYGAVGRILPYGNPFVGLVGGAYQALSGELDEKTRDKTTMQILTDNPSIRRVLSTTSPYAAIKESQAEIKQKGATQNWVQDRTVDDLSQKYLKHPSPSILKELSDYIEKQPEEDQDRLTSRVSSMKELWNVPDRAWWMSLKHTTDPEIRAEVFFNKFQKSSPDEKKRLMDIADAATGIATERFINKLEELTIKKPAYK